MNEIQNTILWELTSKTKPIQRHFLLNRLHVRFNDLSDRAMRKEVELMITAEHIPVGSNEEGYFLIRTQDDLQKAIHSLDAKAEAISIRKNCLKNNYQEFGNDKQKTLF